MVKRQKIHYYINQDPGSDKYGQEDPALGIIIDWKWVRKQYDALNMPKIYHDPLKPDFEKFGYSIDMSDRSRGKTTNKLIVGLILYRKSGKTRIVLAAAIDNLVLNMVVGTFFLFSYTGKPYNVVTLTPRVVVSAVSFVVEVVLLMSLLQKLLPVVRKLMDKELTSTSKPSGTPETKPEESQYQS